MNFTTPVESVTACLTPDKCMNWCMQQHLSHDLSYVVLLITGILALIISGIVFIPDDKKKYLLYLLAAVTVGTLIYIRMMF